tara:strand:- start:1517 stop:1921 length:405 start_codon:yes stop_codon:yes gene_type:complete
MGKTRKFCLKKCPRKGRKTKRRVKQSAGFWPFGKEDEKPGEEEEEWEKNRKWALEVDEEQQRIRDTNAGIELGDIVRHALVEYNPDTGEGTTFIEAIDSLAFAIKELRQEVNDLKDKLGNNLEKSTELVRTVSE